MPKGMGDVVFPICDTAFLIFGSVMSLLPGKKHVMHARLGMISKRIAYLSLVSRTNIVLRKKLFGWSIALQRKYWNAERTEFNRRHSKKLRSLANVSAMSSKRCLKSYAAFSSKRTFLPY